MSDLVKRLDAVIATELPGPTKSVLFYVTYRDSGNGCFASLSTMAKDTGFHRSTVIRTLSQLVAEGYLTKEDQARGKPAIYRQVVAERNHLPKLQVVAERNQVVAERNQVVAERNSGGSREEPKQEGTRINKKLTEGKAQLKPIQAQTDEERPQTFQEYMARERNPAKERTA